MKKLLAIILTIFLAFPVHAGCMGKTMGNTKGKVNGMVRGQSVPSHFPPGLTFYADYTKATQRDPKALYPCYAAQDYTPAYQVAKSATTPSSYIDKNGVIQVTTTSNLPDFTNGYYDTTGFHLASGYLAEATATNYCKDSYFANGTGTYWTAGGTATIAKSSDVVNVYGGYQVMKLVGSADMDRLIGPTFTSASSTTYTVSTIVSGSGSVKLRFYQGDTGSNDGSAITLTATPSRYSWTVANVNGGTASRCAVVQNGAGAVTCYVYSMQVESAPYPTSFIPTTTAALTRADDVLTYLTAGNRNANEETILIKFTPLGGSFANDGVGRFLVTTQATSRRRVYKPTGAGVTSNPQGATSGTCVSTTTMSPAVNTSYVLGSVIKISSPYVTNYINGRPDGTPDTTHSWSVVNFAGGTFYIGSNYDVTSGANCIIQKVAIFNRALTANEVLVATQEMNR
jgi:hypothetical protein